VVAVPATFEDSYRLPLDRLASALTPSTRLVSLASPQNPAGVRLADQELDDLLTVVEERAPQALVLLDETYREATYGDAPAPASYASSSPRVITCSSLSKAHGAPGLRVGWLTTTRADLYERLREAKFASTIGGSTVDEFLARRVLQRREQVLGPRAERLRHALDELLAWVDGQPLEIVPPDGGAMCCLRLPPDRFGDEAVEAFHRGLAGRETRVAHGSWFGEDDRVFRLGFGHLEPAEFTAALDRVAETLADLR
jgi:aspartate/methionine/tyrosine aminotransferase